MVAAAVGVNIAALKVYLALAISAEELLDPVQVSLSDLEKITGLSRPMLTRGIRLLEDRGVISVNRTGYKSTYHLVQAQGERHFAKVPRAVLCAGLQKLPNRGAAALGALKAYFTLVTVRRRGEHLSLIGHKKLQQWTGIRPDRITNATGMLLEHGVIRWAKPSEMGDAFETASNPYYLVGQFYESDAASDREWVELPPTPLDEINDLNHAAA